VKLNKETKIGLTVIAAIALAIWGFNLLKGRDIFKKTKIFHAIYFDINGLTPSCPVKVNGLKIGTVISTEFLENDTMGRILVSFRIDNNDYKIPVDSRARILSSDLLGSKEIRIVPGKSKNMLENGDTLKSEVELGLQQQVSEMVAPLKQKIEGLISSVDTVVIAVKSIFDQEGMANIANGLTSLRKSIQNIEQASAQINQILTNEKGKISNIVTNLESITGNLKTSNKDIANIIRNVSDISDTLKRAQLGTTIKNVNLAIQKVDSVLYKVNSGEGTLGQLINNKSIYNMVDSTVVSLNRLINDIKSNPGDYVDINIIKIERRKPRKE